MAQKLFKIAILCPLSFLCLDVAALEQEHGGIMRRDENKFHRGSTTHSSELLSQEISDRGELGGGSKMNSSAQTASMRALFQLFQDVGDQIANADEPVTGPVNKDAQKVFEHVFDANQWGSRESRSGTGSEVGSKTVEYYRKCLGEWMHKYKVKKFLDVPCGDGNWQHTIPGIQNVSYFGYDIAPGTVELAKKKNKDHKNMQFGVLDLSSADPPRFDMILVKQVIQHVPLDMGVKMVQHVKASGIRYLAASHFPNGKNVNIKIGQYYNGPNLEAPPFNMKPHIETCPGQSSNPFEKLVIYDMQQQDAIR